MDSSVCVTYVVLYILLGSDSDNSDYILSVCVHNIYFVYENSLKSFVNYFKSM